MLSDHMVKKLLFLVVFLLSAPMIYAQYYWDVGFHAGGANYLGEIGGTDQSRRDFIYDIKMNQTRWMTGAFARYRLNQNISVSFGINYGRIQGADSLTNFSERFGRNLSFRNNIIETYTRTEYYFYTVNDVGSTGRYRLDFRAFLFAGAGVFYHNPQAKIDGKWHSLQPLNTEGPGNTYSRVQPAIPLGVGLYYTFKRRHRIGWEFGWRLTFTDYLDDASTFYPDPENLDSDLARSLSNRSGETANDPRHPGVDKYVTGSIRGNPDNNDNYLFSSFTYSWVIRGSRRSIKHRTYYFQAKRKRRRTKAKF